MGRLQGRCPPKPRTQLQWGSCCNAFLMVSNGEALTRFVRTVFGFQPLKGRDTLSKLFEPSRLFSYRGDAPRGGGNHLQSGKCWFSDPNSFSPLQLRPDLRISLVTNMEIVLLWWYFRLDVCTFKKKMEQFLFCWGEFNSGLVVIIK